MMLVCGEALLDVFAAGETRTGLTLDANVGGSPFNVAIGLARLGQPVSFLGALSRDFLGERLIRALQDEGVDATPIARVDARTTLGLVGTDSRGAPSYAFYGEGVPTGNSASMCSTPCQRTSTPFISARFRWWSSRRHRHCARWSSANAQAR